MKDNNQIHASELFAHGMMTVASKLFLENYNRSRHFFDKIPPTFDELEEFMVDGTFARCYDGSKRLLWLLAMQHSGQFSHLMILKSSTANSTPFKNDAFDYYHAFALAQGTDGVWFAGSPANYDPKYKERDLLTDIVASTSIGDIIDHMNWKVGGSWPDADTIDEVIKLNGGRTYHEPFPGTLAVVEIYRRYDQNEINKCIIS